MKFLGLSRLLVTLGFAPGLIWFWSSVLCLDSPYNIFAAEGTTELAFLKNRCF